jgi:hypothetical protein
MILHLTNRFLGSSISKKLKLATNMPSRSKNNNNSNNKNNNNCNNSSSVSEKFIGSVSSVSSTVHHLEIERDNWSEISHILSGRIEQSPLGKTRLQSKQFENGTFVWRSRATMVLLRST